MRKYSIVLIVVSILALAFCIKRDLIFAKDYAGDLRNRVVGARLIKDGISPYYYKWETKDGIRYYDQAAFFNAKVSNITATPFFHELLIPIADYPQVVIQKIWLAIEYILFIVILAIALSFCPDLEHKAMVFAVGMLLLFTEAWKIHLSNQQIYLFIPFFAALFLFFFAKHKSWYSYVLAGLFAVSFILIRPNVAIFFLPFIILLPRISLKRVLLISIPFIIAGCWILFDNTELQYWKDFYVMIGEHVNAHQGLPVQLREITPSPNYNEFEGINIAENDKYEQKHSIISPSESGNFSILFYKLCNYKIPYKIVSGFSLLIIIALFYFFYRRNKNIPLSHNSIILLTIFGFSLYMLSDLFSPVTRHQYYTVQWFIPLLLAFALYRPAFKWYYIFLAIGIILNVGNHPILKMQYTIGEYLILITLLLFSFSYTKKLAYE
jgi:hypothetical protein